MKAFDLLLPDVLPMAPGCPEPVAERALMRAAQRFCELSRCWRVVLDPMPIAQGLDDYDLELPECSELVRIEAAKLNGCDVRVKMPDEILSRSARYLAISDGRTFHMNPLPEADGELLATVTLKPSSQAWGIEDFIHDRYGETVAQGAVALLMQHPQKSYSSNEGAARWQAFESRGITVRTSLWRGLGRSNAHTTPNWF
jgi:hypothetical protein